MKNILLIDADSKIPNLALMKLSKYHKDKGDNVTLEKANLPYYPNRNKNFYIKPEGYDIAYCSVIFEGNKNYILGDDIIFGGTGVDLITTLPDEIENYKPDYSIYPDNVYSYGFITRGCIRNCSFCKVPKKEGYIHLVNNPEDIIEHKKIKFLDNNILAYHKHKEILEKLIDINLRYDFSQGLDIRLLDKENALLLEKMKVINKYTFAFDDIKYKNIIKEKLKLLKWRKEGQIRFFVYVNPNMKISDTIKRIIYLKNEKCLPYVMRDISCWKSKYSDFYVDIASYCNQVNFFEKMTFEQFLEKRHPNNCQRVNKNIKIYRNNK